MTKDQQFSDHTNIECPKCHCWRWGYIGETCRSEGCDGIMCARFSKTRLIPPTGVDIFGLCEWWRVRAIALETENEKLSDYIKGLPDETSGVRLCSCADGARYRWLREALDNEEVTQGLHEAFQQGSTALDRAIDERRTVETPARHLQPSYVLEQIMNNSTDPWAKGVARTCLMGTSEKAGERTPCKHGATHGQCQHCLDAL
jgi:hypothetical protein